MPDDKKYGTYRKDLSGKYTIDNIAWDTVAKARAAINKQWHHANKNNKTETEEWLEKTKLID